MRLRVARVFCCVLRLFSFPFLFLSTTNWWLKRRRLQKCFSPYSNRSAVSQRHTRKPCITRHLYQPADTNQRISEENEENCRSLFLFLGCTLNMHSVATATAPNSPLRWCVCLPGGNEVEKCSVDERTFSYVRVYRFFLFQVLIFRCLAIQPQRQHRAKGQLSRWMDCGERGEECRGDNAVHPRAMYADISSRIKS